MPLFLIYCVFLYMIQIILYGHKVIVHRKLSVYAPESRKTVAPYFL
jgi:hypothetical protein